MTLTLRPGVPRSPADLVLDGRVSSWLLPSGGMLNIFHDDTMVEATAARFITTEVDAAMKRAAPTAPKYVYIHDFSRTRGYTTDGRRVLTDWGIQSRSIVRQVMVLYPRGNKLFQMGVEVAVALLRVGGVNMHSAQTLTEAFARVGLSSSAVEGAQRA